MRIGLLLCLSSWVWATDFMYYMELPVQVQEGQIAVQLKPAPFVSFETLKDDRQNIDRAMVELSLDSALRQTVYLMRTLERNRGTIMANKAPIEILSFKWELAKRDLTGKPEEVYEYETTLLLGAEENQGLIRFEDKEFAFTLNDLTDQAAYETYLKHLIFPFESKTFALNNQDAFLVDLYFQWPKVLVKESEFNVFDLFPSLILWNKGPITKIKIHLGTTYAHLDSGQWSQENSTYLARHKQAIELYEQVLVNEQNNRVNQAIQGLEEYLQMVPTDKKALKLLMDLYLSEEMEDEAYSLISRFQPIFATIRDGLTNQKSLAAEASQKRNFLLGKRRDFRRDRKVELKITAPENMDMVTGKTYLEFALAAHDAPILQIDCYADEELIGSMTEPPFRAAFTSNGGQRSMELRVMAYFENETYQEARIRVRTVDVDEEEWVNLVPVRTVVTAGSRKFLTDLNQEDFKVFENGKECKIEHFRKDQSPLRVAILIDTSISMFGEKLYNAQYAVHSFLSKLQPEDRAEIYTFDHRVLRLAPFSNHFDVMGNQVFTLSPQLSTSLYDAILAAVDDLNGQNGNKVIIIVSDGSDSSSVSTDIHVTQALQRSSAMVYSLIMPGDFLGQSNQLGNLFLEEIAKYTGSIATKVRKVRDLDQEFDQIYEELKSFYYLDYYSKASKGDREIQIKAKGGKARHRVIAQ
ncbi:MAG: VWA domain-containing protein [Acidobacteria bacterium]|nr:VWA domain-containing protein [Acidobacteriota bacterium]